MRLELKGQGMIIQVIIFAVVIFFSITLVLLVPTDSDGIGSEQEIQGFIDSNFAAVEDESAFNYLLHHEINNWTESDNQYNATAYELSREYFVGDEVKINGEKFEKDTVKQDLEAFLGYEYSSADEVHKTNLFGRRGIINITSTNRDEYIEVRRGLQGADINNWESYSRNSKISGGEIEFTYWAGRR